MLQKWGNAKASTRWLATWTDTMYHKPGPNHPRKVKEFMRQKYVEKSYYWDPEEQGPPPAPPTLITTRPSEKDLWKLEQEAQQVAKKLDQIQVPGSYTNGFPPPPPKWTGPTAPVNLVNETKVVKEEPKTETLISFADFASAFPVPSTFPTKSNDAPLKLDTEKPITTKPVQKLAEVTKEVKVKPKLEIKPVQSYIQTAQSTF